MIDDLILEERNVLSVRAESPRKIDCRARKRPTLNGRKRICVTIVFQSAVPKPWPRIALTKPGAGPMVFERAMKRVQ